MAVTGVQLIGKSLVQQVLSEARNCTRGRKNHNFHSAAEDAVHRFLNVLTRDTYIVPHRHLNPPKHESFVVLEGSAAVIAFSADGAVEDCWVLGGGDLFGVDLPAGLWHTVVALTEYAVCFEVKPGPWDPASDKEFAPWAPPEQDREAACALLAQWKAAAHWSEHNNEPPTSTERSSD